MRYLADDRDAYQALDEPPHHRRRDEGSHPAHAQRTEQQEEASYKDCKGRGQRVEIRSSLHRDAAHGQCGDQACCRVRAHDQQARRSEQRVGDQRWDDGVKAHDRGDPDDAGISHALRYDDRPDCQPRQSIRQQPLAPIGWQPVENGQQPLCDGASATLDRHSRLLWDYHDRIWHYHQIPIMADFLFIRSVSGLCCLFYCPTEIALRVTETYSILSDKRSSPARRRKSRLQKTSAMALNG